MTKKTLMNCLKLTLGIITISGLVSTSNYYLLNAAPATNSGASCPADSDFLGFPNWYRGLKCDNNSIDLKDEQLGSVALVIGLNVVDIMLRMASLVSVGFIVYGGYIYIVSSKDASYRAVAKAQTTITGAVVGLIVCIASVAIVGFISARLGQ